MARRALLTTVAVVGVLTAGVAVTDGVLHEQTEQRLADDLRAQIPGLQAEPEVTIHGFPFLTQVLAGELDRVDVSAAEATVNGLLIEDVEVRIQDVSTARPTTAGHVRLTATTSVESMATVLALPLELRVDGEHLVASADVLGLQLEVLLDPRPGGREIPVEVVGVRLGGATVSTSDLPGVITDRLQGLAVPLEALPPGLTVTEVRLEPGGARLTFEGTDVVLDDEGLG